MVSLERQRHLQLVDLQPQEKGVSEDVFIPGLVPSRLPANQAVVKP